MVKSQYEFFATTAKGMEDLLADELKEICSVEVKVGRAGVSFTGSLETAYRACLWSRIANRILLPLKTFPAASPDQLYGGVRSIHWTEHMTVEDTLAVDFSCSLSKITHTHFGALKVKDAIVDQFRSVVGSRPSVDPVTPKLRINVYVHKDTATVSLDLSGDSLHRRGYREQGARAPLKENLAAALLKIAGWPKQKDVSFLDPMCGSGTLAIEAGLMAANIAPGLRREYYGFLGWQGHIPKLWKRLLQEAEEVQVRDKKELPRIVGYDQDFRAVRVALGNIEKAGLAGKVHIEKKDFLNCQAIGSRGILIVNPPYGERLGESEQLKPLYKGLGDIFKQRFKGWDAYVFTGNPDLMKSIGLKASKRVPLWNGAIECRLLKYDLY